MRRPAVSLVAAALLVAGCGGGTAPAIKLDGSPRTPNLEGEVTLATRTKVVIGGRSLKVADDLRVFSSATLKTISLAGREHQYVQAGVAGGTLKWMAVYGAVLRLPGQPPVAYHVGTLAAVAGGKATFRDGSVLTLGPGVQPPATGQQATAEIDADAKQVRSLRAG